MYPHRLVVDANCINAKGGLPAMTALEKYHHAGALELIVTSTLSVELHKGSIQARKARLYQSVGAYPLYFPGEQGAQSRIGAPVRQSLLHLLHQELFGRNLKGKTLLRAVRDCLHLDQAQMNGADIFVTNDRRLHAAEPLLARHGVHLSICTPEQALNHVRSYYLRSVGGDDLRRVKEAAQDQGPIILGSNSCGGCSFIAARADETLATITIEGGLLRIGGRFRDEHGQLLVELKPGERPEFPFPGVSLTQNGSGPILVADEAMGSLVVAADSQTYLAVRMTHTGRAVISKMELRDEAGQLVVAVQKESLVLQGANMRF
jgi:hypothetical protein